MGKMETLRASVCVAQNKRPNKTEENKITVLKRGQDNVEKEIDPATFDPTTWKEDVKNLAEMYVMYFGVALLIQYFVNKELKIIYFSQSKDQAQPS